MNTVSIVMYHYIRDLTHSRYPGIKGLDLSLFRQQLDFLQSRYTVIRCEDVLAAINGEKKIDKPACVLTFDDGYLDHYTNVFPLLRERGITGFFSMPGKIIKENKLLDVNKIHFLLAAKPIELLLPMIYERLDHYRGSEYPIPPTKELYNKLAISNRFDSADVIFVKRLLQVELEETLRGKIVDDLFASIIGLPETTFAHELYMSMDQVRLMAREGMEWGIHGYDHYWMNRLEESALQRDVMQALDVFDGVTNRNGWICVYPYGSTSESVINVVKEMGAIGGLGTEVGPCPLSRQVLYSMPRFDANDFPPKSENYRCFLK